MRKMFKLTGALLILAGGLLVTLTPKSAEALTCRQEYQECSASCDPQDSGCFESCQCTFLTCKGLPCN